MVSNKRSNSAESSSTSSPAVRGGVQKSSTSASLTPSQKTRQMRDLLAKQVVGCPLEIDEQIMAIVEKNFVIKADGSDLVFQKGPFFDETCRIVGLWVSVKYQLQNDVKNEELDLETENNGIATSAVEIYMSQNAVKQLLTFTFAATNLAKVFLERNETEKLNKLMKLLSVTDKTSSKVDETET